MLYYVQYLLKILVRQTPDLPDRLLRLWLLMDGQTHNYNFIYMIVNTPQAGQYGVYNAQVHYTPDCPAWGALTGLYPTSH